MTSDTPVENPTQIWRYIVVAFVAPIIHFAVPLIPAPPAWAMAIRLAATAVVIAALIRWLIRDSRSFVPTAVRARWMAALWVLGGIAVMIGPQLPTAGRHSDQASAAIAEGVAQLGMREGSLTTIGLVLGSAMIAPVAEELIYRAAVFGGWRELFLQFMPRGAGIGVAAFISGLAFSFAHFTIHPFQAFIYLAAGAVWALAYHFAGSLLVPVFIHAVCNSFQFWLMLHGPNRAFDGGAANLALLLLAPFLAVGLAWLVTRAFTSRTADGRALRPV